MYLYIDDVKSKNKQLTGDEGDGWEILLDIIAPEVITHMISLDLKIEYNDALEILYNPFARQYGELVDSHDIVSLFKPNDRTVDRSKRVRRSKN